MTTSRISVIKKLSCKLIGHKYGSIELQECDIVSKVCVMTRKCDRCGENITWQFINELLVK